MHQTSDGSRLLIDKILMMYSLPFLLQQSPPRIANTVQLSSDSEFDSPSYFTSSAPISHTPTRIPRGRRRRTSSSADGIPRVHPPQSPPAKSSNPHLLELKSSSSVLGLLSALWQTEGAWGIYKGTNSTYVHSILLSTITSFVRSFFSAFFALPDPGLSFTSSSAGPSSYTGGLDILCSPSPYPPWPSPSQPPGSRV